MTRDVVFLLLFPSPLHPLLSTIKIHFFRLPHGTVGLRGIDRSFRNSPELGAGEDTGGDKIDAVELDDLENNDISEEETKRAEVDAASCNPKLPKHMASCMGRLEQASVNRTENSVRFQGPLAECSDGFSRKSAILCLTSHPAAARFCRSFRISLCKTSQLLEKLFYSAVGDL